MASAGYLKSWRRSRAQVRQLLLSSSEEDHLPGEGEFETHPTIDLPTKSNFITDIPTQAIDDAESGMHIEHDDEIELVLESDSDSDLFWTDDSELETPDTGSKLAAWAVSSGTSRGHLNNLLGLLREGGMRLPKDARTLLHTPRGVQHEVRCGGTYKYYGIETGILTIASQYPAAVHIALLKSNSVWTLTVSPFSNQIMTSFGLYYAHLILCHLFS